MNSKTTRLVAGVGVVVVAIVLLIVLSSGGSDGGDSSAGTVPKIVVKNAKPVGGITDLEYKKGDQIKFEVEGDKGVGGEEIHVHGYDLHKDIPQGGGTVTFAFPASIEGVFEAELEGHKEQIIQLTVNP
jgi:hypothetical protein